MTRVHTQLLDVVATINSSGGRCAVREAQTFLLAAGTAKFTGGYRVLPGGGADLLLNAAQPADQCRELRALGINFDLTVDHSGAVREITAVPAFSNVDLAN